MFKLLGESSKISKPLRITTKHNKLSCSHYHNSSMFTKWAPPKLKGKTTLQMVPKMYPASPTTRTYASISKPTLKLPSQHMKELPTEPTKSSRWAQREFSTLISERPTFPKSIRTIPRIYSTRTQSNMPITPSCPIKLGRRFSTSNIPTISLRTNMKDIPEPCLKVIEEMRPKRQSVTTVVSPSTTVASPSARESTIRTPWSRIRKSYSTTSLQLSSEQISMEGMSGKNYSTTTPSMQLFTEQTNEGMSSRKHYSTTASIELFSKAQSSTGMSAKKDYLTDSISTKLFQEQTSKVKSDQTTMTGMPKKHYSTATSSTKLFSEQTNNGMSTRIEGMSRKNYSTAFSSKKLFPEQTTKTGMPRKHYSTDSSTNLLLKAQTNKGMSAKKHYSTTTSSMELISKEQAVQFIKPNSLVFVEGVVGTPKVLMNAMYDHVKSKNIQGVTVLDVFSLYPYDNMTPEDDCVRRLSFFVSPYTRKYVNTGAAEYIPIMLNDLPMVFDRGYFSPDVALISVSPPDASGFVSLGTNVVELLSVIRGSKRVIAQINDRMPRSLGEALVHVSEIDYGVEVSYELFSPATEEVTEIDSAIANHICDELLEDEATLQIGLGKIPEAILSNIKHQINLGVHTELLTPGVIKLFNSGVINNSKKSIDRGQITATLLLGDKPLYDFVHNNELVQMKRGTYSNDPAIIRQNHRMTAINTCLEIDITGQVVSDSLGTRIYSGFGGQVDFMRGALTGLDGKGKAILALPSTDVSTGLSKIVPTIKPGAGVVCSRAHVQYVVTEYGCADLFAKSTRQRAHALIRIAHPQHREALEREAYEILKVMPSL